MKPGSQAHRKIVRGAGVVLVRPTEPSAYGTRHRLLTPAGAVDATWLGGLCRWLVQPADGGEYSLTAETAGDRGWTYLDALGPRARDTD